MRGEERLAGSRESDVAACAVEQFGAEFALESRDLSAQRRLCQVQVLGGAGEVSESRDLHEPAELLEVHLHSLPVSFQVGLCIGVIRMA